MSLKIEMDLVQELLYKPVKSTAVPVNLLLSEDGKAIQLLVIELAPSSSGPLFSWFRVMKARRGRLNDNEEFLALSNKNVIRIGFRETSESITFGA